MYKVAPVYAFILISIFNSLFVQKFTNFQNFYVESAFLKMIRCFVYLLIPCFIFILLKLLSKVGQTFDIYKEHTVIERVQPMWNSFADCSLMSCILGIFCNRYKRIKHNELGHFVIYIYIYFQHKSLINNCSNEIDKVEFWVNCFVLDRLTARHFTQSFSI